MLCAECSQPTKVIDTVEIEGNFYRKRKCLSCNHTFYTGEFEVNYKRIKEKWNKNYRRVKSRSLK